MIEYFTKSDTYKEFKQDTIEFKEDMTRLYRNLSADIKYAVCNHKVDIITMVCLLYFGTRILIG